jgi:hypothetical protein
LILANLSVVVLSPTGGDPRICFPSLPLHILLGLALFSSAGADGAVRAFDAAQHLRRRWRAWLLTFGAVCVVALCIRLVAGRRYANRPLREPLIVWHADVALDRTRPSLSDDLHAGVGGLVRSRVGETVRAAYVSSNEMYPPKFIGAVPGIPSFAGDIRQPTYYVGRWPDGYNIGVSYAGAIVESGTREGDAVEAEGIVQAEGHGDAAPFWLMATKVRRLRRNAQ